MIEYRTKERKITMAIIETLSTSSMISSLSSSCTTTNKIMDDPVCNDTLLTTYFGFSTTIAAGTFKDDLNKKLILKFLINTSNLYQMRNWHN